MEKSKFRSKVGKNLFICANCALTNKSKIQKKPLFPELAFTALKTQFFASRTEKLSMSAETKLIKFNQITFVSLRLCLKYPRLIHRLAKSTFPGLRL